MATETPEHQATRIELDRERRDRHDDLMTALNEIRADFRAHLSEERPLMNEAREFMHTHGDPALIRARIDFINEWMEAARERKALRRAVIEKTTIGAFWAVLVYLAIAVGNDLKDVLKHWMIR